MTGTDGDRKRPHRHGPTQLKESRSSAQSKRRKIATTSRGIAPPMSGNPSYPSDSESDRDTVSSEDSDDSDAKPKHHPPMAIDWRHALCTLLKQSPGISDKDLLDAMYLASDTLREAERLRYAVLQEQGPPRCEVIYKITCHDSRFEELYLDEPWVVQSGPYDAHLRGSQPVSHLELHLERNKEIAFIVYRNFECCRAPPPKHFSYHGRVSSVVDSDPSSFFKGEYMTIVSEDLSVGLQGLAEEALVGIPHPKFNRRSDDMISYPYLWWFHRRKEIQLVTELLDSVSQSQIAVFQYYVQARLAEEWSIVDSLLAESKITTEYISYLFVPNTVLVSKSDGDKKHQLRGVIATDWLMPGNNQNIPTTIQVTLWNFHGTFHQSHDALPIGPPPTVAENEAFPIKDLIGAYPAKFATSEIVERLKARGRMFWKCRHRNYISSSRFSGDGVQASTDSRFMVDFTTYIQMHPDNDLPSSNDALGPLVMSQDNPELGDDFFMCLPATIFGFNMHKKEWVNLEVDFIRDVEWNEEAFEHLVIDPGTKRLVKAVVTTQLRAEEHTDLIQGKGNGLFILLHGGPGTGKTLTAERYLGILPDAILISISQFLTKNDSVAEIAKKPLYRVTCGDIGTKAEDVEKYLDTVLLLGKTWGCVVLLDEADVFLEERTLQNLERNALVSVFLRVLEYYDGILILTSNRVGTFDEAFKSRIQLNLRYNNLNEDQRLRIWYNFISRIETMHRERLAITDTSGPSHQDMGINAEEIRARIPELAKTDLNGREIRNAISTARQLAGFEEKPLGYEHILSVIQEARKFDEYLKELNQWYTADDKRRGRGER